MKRNGFTIIEVIFYVAIFSTTILLLSNFINLIFKNTKKAEIQTRAQLEINNALFQFNTYLRSANEFVSVSSYSCIFICDSSIIRNYNPVGDYDSDGIINIRDPDIDGDYNNRFKVGKEEQWKYGYNIEDDDEMSGTNSFGPPFGDGKVDVRIKLFFDSVNHKLYQGISYNDVDYANASNEFIANKLIAEISVATFSYFGSSTIDPLLDLNKDGRITSDEIGITASVCTDKEKLRYIASFYVYLEADVNKDGKIDATGQTEIYLPLVQAKRKRKVYE